jgi:hypothetical protein
VTRRPLTIAAALIAVLSVAPVSSAQFQMPDPKQMSGIPRPVDDLPAGSVSVRLIRGSLSNNIAGHPVDLVVGGKKQTVKTDESGRAQFDKLPAGATVRASADVDGEHLESQEFPAPAQGGIRLMLVATDKNAGPATSPDAPAVSGEVVLTNQSRIVMEPGDEAVNVFYLLDIENTARVPVNPPRLFAFDLPADAVGSGIMQGSSPNASLSGRRVLVTAPFPPGHTFVQVGMAIPSTSGSIEVNQAFPAALTSLAVVAQKVGDARLTSPQIQTQREMPADGQTFIAATGGAVSAGQTIALTLDGLPHHSGAGRMLALSLAVLIVGIGIVFSGKPQEPAGGKAGERKKLLARRERLLNDLARLEQDHRSGRGMYADDSRYAARREDLIAALEAVYSALDEDGPEPADRAGVAA